MNAQIEKIAKGFSTIIRESLSHGEMMEVNKKNFTPEYMDSCPTHDYCDANEAMAEAIWKVLGREVDTQNEDDCTLWGDAWDMARKYGYYANYFMIFDVKAAKLYEEVFTMRKSAEAKKKEMGIHSLCIQSITYYRGYQIVANDEMPGADAQCATIYDKDGNMSMVARGIVEKVSLEEKAIAKIESKFLQTA